jgi:four helix bundle protein
MEKEQRPHKNLEVWKNSMELAKKIYKITGSFPASEIYGLVSQMRRAVVSILSNISEGAARSGKKEFLQFINIAQGSASELDTQIELAKELEYITQQNYDEMISLLTIISKQLYGLARRIKGKM